MAVFACGEHDDGCLRKQCIDRAVAVRMAMNGVSDNEPPMPSPMSIIAAGRRGGKTGMMMEKMLGLPPRELVLINIEEDE